MVSIAPPERSIFFAAYLGHPPWDVGHPQPCIADLVSNGALNGSVLDVGCGTGEHTLMAAERGHPALGLDMVPAAIVQARAKAVERGLDAQFMVADILQPDSLDGRFDTVIDSGVFHVFGDEDRPIYAGRLHELLRPGGRLLLVCFSDSQPGNEGPRRVSEAELRAAFDEGWKIQTLEPTRFQSTVHEDGARAWLAVIERE